MLDYSNYRAYHHARTLTAREEPHDLEDMSTPYEIATLGSSNLDISAYITPTAFNVSSGTARHVFKSTGPSEFRKLSFVIFEGDAPAAPALTISDQALLCQSFFRPAPSERFQTCFLFDDETEITPATQGWVHCLQESAPLLKPSAVERFHDLASRWRNERNPLGSVLELCTHLAYQQIIGMGQDAVPLILRELEKETDHWFWALGAITGANPVPDAHRGRVNLMAQDWLDWAKTQGYQW